jgi:hypothetical protein
MSTISKAELPNMTHKGLEARRLDIGRHRKHTHDFLKREIAFPPKEHHPGTLFQGCPHHRPMANTQ